MSTLKIKDNSPTEKNAFVNIPNLTAKIADKTLEQLEHEGLFIFPNAVHDSEDMTEDQTVLQSNNCFYCTGNLMGFLGLGEERLVIESRFCGNENDYFFQYLLSKVLDYPNIVDANTDADFHQRLFSLLLFLFPFYLRLATRKGLLKTYILQKNNDPHIKGTIDIARHISKNTPFIGNIAYNLRSFSYDNEVMELVRHTIEYMKKKPYGNRLLAKAKDEVRLVIDATPGYEAYDLHKIVEKNKKNPVRHAYYREYLALQRLCLLILQQRKHQIGTGSRQIYGILFDGAWLWEEYIHSLIGGTFFHPRNKSGQGSQLLFDGHTGKIYPDFISRDSLVRVIADAKYKPVDHIGNKDYLQLLAYMFRFDAKMGYFLYPEVGKSDDVYLRLNQGSTYEGNVTPRDDVGIIKHGLKIPIGVESYEAFSEQMLACEQDFIQIFAKA